MDARGDAVWLDDRFDEQRGRLRGVAYRMLGSEADADDAVQEAWIRIHRAGADGVDNIAGWFTTVLARVCLTMLRTRARRREAPLDPRVPDPVIGDVTDGPEDAAVLADSVGLALLVVLDTLTPPERVAFVLHDLFDVSYDEIAAMLERTPGATRQLASRARRQVHGATVADGAAGRQGQRRLVDAFFAAARDGDLTALAAVLHPDATLRIDGGASRPGSSAAVRGAEAVAAYTSRGLRSLLHAPAIALVPATVNGVAGVVATVHGRPASIIGFELLGDRIVGIDAVADPERVAALVGDQLRS